MRSGELWVSDEGNKDHEAGVIEDHHPRVPVPGGLLQVAHACLGSLGSAVQLCLFSNDPSV